MGDRKSNIDKAISELSSNKYIEVLFFSDVYKTSPLYFKKQNNFYNNVVKIKTSLNPPNLLKTLQNIEQKIGRKINVKKNMPRLIDLDILTYNKLIINTDDLKIPHPYISDRKFVLVPFNDLDPMFIVPDINKTITELLNNIKDSSKIIKLSVNKR